MHMSPWPPVCARLSPVRCAALCCAAHVAAAVANKAYNNGVATELPRPHDVLDKSYSWWGHGGGEVVGTAGWAGGGMVQLRA